MCVTANQYRAVPGRYILPFGEGEYTVVPRREGDETWLYVQHTSAGQFARYSHPLSAIASHTARIDYGFVEHVQWIGLGGMFKVEPIRSCFPVSKIVRGGWFGLQKMHVPIVYTDSSPQFDFFQEMLLDKDLPRSETFQDWLSAWRMTKPSPVTTHL